MGCVFLKDGEVGDVVEDVDGVDMLEFELELEFEVYVGDMVEMEVEEIGS